jgi:hypothetical protein
MRSLLLRFQRELTVLAAVLIATGGFAIAALVSEGSQAVDAGTYVVRSDTSGLLVTGEVLDVTTNARGKTVTVVKWDTRQGPKLTRTLRASAGPVIRTVTEAGATITLPVLAPSETQTVHATETITNTATVVDTVAVTETVVATETVIEPPVTVTVGTSGSP